MLLAFKKWLISVFNPPYQLALSDKIVEKRAGRSLTIYVFKQYGSHDYVKVTYSDLLNNPGMLTAINPIHLMDIHLHEYLLKQEADKFHIVETLRNNQYKLSNTSAEAVYSGEYICKNADMFANLSHIDISKIAYQSGFIKGRKISNEVATMIQQKIQAQQEEALFQNQDSHNVVHLTDYLSNNKKSN